MSETTNLKLFKHDNPETNKDQFNVDKSLNKNWDKIDESAGKVNTKITALEADNATNKKDIVNIKQEQKTQNTNISNLQTDITNIKEEQEEQNKYIAELEAEHERLRQDMNGLPSRTS